jgi:hypothetical protein
MTEETDDEAITLEKIKALYPKATVAEIIAALQAKAAKTQLARLAIARRAEKPRHRMPRGPPPPRLAFTIEEFCVAHGISPETYFKLKRHGWQPREMKVGKRVLISFEAAADWRRRREAVTAGELTNVAPGTT